MQLLVIWCIDGIKKLSNRVDHGFRGCGCLGLGHHLQEEWSYIRDGSNVRVNYSGFRIFSLIGLLRHQTIDPCKVGELHRHQNIFLDKTAQTDYLPL